MVLARLNAASWAAWLAAVVGLVVAATPSLAADKKPAEKAADKPVAAADGKVYELRIYTCHPGRLDALNKRFRDHTMRLFEKHGIKNVIYLTPVDKEDTLIYLIVHDSPEAAQKSWQSFRDDAEWQKVRDESHRDGLIVKKVESQYLKATEYSPQK